MKNIALILVLIVLMLPGCDWFEGKRGKNGVDGIAGDPGQRGVAGITGPTGGKGDTGNDGTDGDPGMLVTDYDSVITVWDLYQDRPAEWTTIRSNSGNLTWPIKVITSGGDIAQLYAGGGQITKKVDVVWPNLSQEVKDALTLNALKNITFRALDIDRVENGVVIITNIISVS